MQFFNIQDTIKRISIKKNLQLMFALDNWIVIRMSVKRKVFLDNIPV